MLNPHMSLINELASLVERDAQDSRTLGGFGSKTRIRVIGEELNRIGGMDLMRAVYYSVKNRGPYFSEDIWDGIGDWQC